MNTLVTFLGKGRDDPQTGYRQTVYRFPDGQQTESTAFFGLALARHLASDSTVILGTSASQWDVLVEHLAVEGDDDARLQLIEAVAKGSVDQPLLDRLAPLLGRSVAGTVIPRLIPFGRDADQQYAILSAIAAAVPSGSASIDLTHGFRHLGMVGFLSAFMLERIRGVTVRDLWYGALDMTRDGVTPVLRLDGLIRVQRWVEALDRFDATGDYGVFAPLLTEDGVAVDKANSLRAAAHYERVLNVPDARRQIHTFLPVLDDDLPGASGLFQRKLADRLRWAKLRERWQWQRALAFQYLDRRDFVRAAMFGWEAWVSQLCSEQGRPGGSGDKVDPNAFNERKEVVDEFESVPQMRHEPGQSDAHWTLKHLRNALAHGTRPMRRYRTMLGDADHLFRELQAALTRLLG